MMTCLDRYFPRWHIQFALRSVNKEPYEDLKHHPHLFVVYKEGHSGDIRKPTLAGWSKSVILSAYMQASVDQAKMTNMPKFEQGTTSFR